MSCRCFAGAGNIWFELPTWLRIVHLALASALWAVLVFAAAWCYLRPVADPESALQRGSGHT